MAALAQRFEGPPPEGDEYASVFYDEVALLIRARGGEAGSRYLLDSASDADALRLRSSFVALAASPADNRPEVLSLLRAGLAHKDPWVVGEAIDGLTRLHASETREQVAALRQDERPPVRGSVLRYLSRIDGSAATSELVAALSDPEALVRENAVDELHELGAVKAIPAIRELSDDPDANVRQAAETALHGLATAPEAPS
jgi:HEAT repeat protein